MYSLATNRNRQYLTIVNITIQPVATINPYTLKV